MEHQSVAIYVRQSEDKTGQEAAVERQEAACRKLADAKGWADLVLYRDNDRSATTGKERPDFERLLRDIEAGCVDAVVVWHLDRLTRTIRDLTRTIEAGKSHRVNIASVHGVSLDLGDPTGVAVATILTAIAAMEVQHKGSRQREANRQRATAGRAFWTRRPFGYDRDADGAVFVVEAEAELIRVGAEAALAGSTLAAIAKQWNAAGFSTTAGGLWGVTQVRRLLMNPRYAGKQVYNGEEMASGGLWQPILDQDTHQALVERLTDPRRRTAPDDLNSKYLLSGICLCGKCGGKMFASPVKVKGRQQMVYRCYSGYCVQRGLEAVDDVVNTVVTARLSRPDAASLFASTVDATALRRKATDLRGRRDALAALLADGLLSAVAVREQAGKLASELHAVESSLVALDTFNPAAAVIAADDVSAAWAALDLGARRQIIRALMDVTVLSAGKGVRFSPEQVQIEWKGGS
ncbi:recombinase family protein [Arthrobacter sp. S39]|uniref:recombinase family protein n=1 Tax=Arthrobacter sp. S39 TaxID=2509720 RepID=UPI0010374235|nr:recombinase family protein [Arthrobacter sp. S39]TAP45619.1 recombinase family protein [Arthrobacter sp. S39]